MGLTELNMHYLLYTVYDQHTTVQLKSMMTIIPGESQLLLTLVIKLTYYCTFYGKMNCAP